MNTIRECTATMSDNLSIKGNCEQQDQATLDHRELIPTKSTGQDSHKHEVEYP